MLYSIKTRDVFLINFKDVKYLENSNDSSTFDTHLWGCQYRLFVFRKFEFIQEISKEFFYDYKVIMQCLTLTKVKNTT